MWDGNTRRKVINSTKHMVEREPMWDGNERVGTDVQSVKRVEREPMWDGNWLEVVRVFIEYELSENQCGMET